MAAELTVVVDAANVVGSRPDGWWRDRAGAARRLRDALTRLRGEVVLPSGGTAVVVMVVMVVMVVEGTARVVARAATVPNAQAATETSSGSTLESSSSNSGFASRSRSSPASCPDQPNRSAPSNSAEAAGPPVKTRRTS